MRIRADKLTSDILRDSLVLQVDTRIFWATTFSTEFTNNYIEEIPEYSKIQEKEIFEFLEMLKPYSPIISVKQDSNVLGGMDGFWPLKNLYFFRILEDTWMITARTYEPLDWKSITPEILEQYKIKHEEEN